MNRSYSVGQGSLERTYALLVWYPLLLYHALVDSGLTLIQSSMFINRTDIVYQTYNF